jgi:protein tyrosine phosphatase (PTP) superfamily phosphohydrolase (DUF442 family)
MVSPGAPLPAGPTTLPDGPTPPPPGPVQSRSPDFSKDLAWKPDNGPSVRLYPPEVSEGTDGSRKPQTREPEVFENDKPAPKLQVPGADKGKVDAYKPSPFPVGIPNFGQVNDHFAGGRRPSLDDGLDWLRDSGYKAVIYLRAPGENDAADRKQVERRGMKFYSLEISPEALNKKLVEDFIAIVSDQANQPVFAYDTDGERSGAMWFLHFRIGQKAGDENSRRQARVLGLREQGAMWDAAQKYANEQ